MINLCSFGVLSISAWSHLLIYAINSATVQKCPKDQVLKDLSPFHFDRTLPFIVTHPDFYCSHLLFLDFFHSYSHSVSSPVRQKWHFFKIIWIFQKIKLEIKLDLKSLIAIFT